MSMRFRNSSYERHISGDGYLQWLPITSGENRANTRVSGCCTGSRTLSLPGGIFEHRFVDAASVTSHKRPVHR
jgi:hypothetical protein